MKIINNYDDINSKEEFIIFMREFDSIVTDEYDLAGLISIYTDKSYDKIEKALNNNKIENIYNKLSKESERAIVTSIVNDEYLIDIFEDWFPIKIEE